MQPVEMCIKRDSHGVWCVSVGSDLGMSRKLENALGYVVARNVDHPFDVRGLAGAVELILGVKEAS
jgi:hypothetical protein